VLLSNIRETSVADPDPESGAFLTLVSGIRNGKKVRILIRNPDPYFLELRNHFLMRIRDGKNSNPG
jgi:hypothetical protein